MLFSRVLSLLLLSLWTLAACGADWTWSGTVSSDWNNKSNWTTTSLAAAPQPTDIVILAGGIAKPSNQNIPNLSILKLVIPAGIQPATVVSGQSISLGSGGLDFQNAASDFAFATPFILTAQQRWSIAANRTLTLTGAVSAVLNDIQITGSISMGSKLITNVSDTSNTSNVVIGMPIATAFTPDTWVESISGNTLTLTRPADLSNTAFLNLTQCWIVEGGATLDLSAVNGANLNAPVLAYAGTVRFGAPTLLKGGAILGRTASLELQSGSGPVTLTTPVVSLSALNADKTEPESAAIKVGAGDTLTIPSAPGVALSLQGGGTQNVFRFPGAGNVRFLTTGEIPEFATGSLRLEGGTTTLNTLSLQPKVGDTAENGCVEFHGSATLNLLANSLVAVTAANGGVTPQIIPTNNFIPRYGPRQLSVVSGVANLNIASGAVFQNNLRPVDGYVLVGSGATLNVSGADDTSIFRLGRNDSQGATSATLNLGRFSLNGGQFYIHAAPSASPYRVFPSQAGFALALNGGVFNGNRCDDFLGDCFVNNAPVGQARIDNFTLSGSGALSWGVGVLEKINVVDDPLGHSSSLGLHFLNFSRAGGAVSVAVGAKLRISAGTVTANGANPFADDTVPLRYVAIENNAVLLISNGAKTFGTLSGSNAGATLQLSSTVATLYSDSDSIYAGKLAGGGTFVKSGSGVLRLNGDSTSFFGPVSVDGGTLVADNGISSTGTQDMTVSTGGTLAGSGKVVGSVILNGTLNAGGVPFVAGDNTLETGSLTVNASGKVLFALTDAPATGDAVSVSGNVAVNGGAVYISNGGGFTTRDYPLVTYSGNLTGDMAQLSLMAMPPGFSGRLLHDVANKAIVLRVFVPPVSTILAPAQNLFRATTWPGVISCSVSDPNSAGIAGVDVSIRKSSGEYFSGTAFTVISETWLPATLNGLNWSMPFPVSNFSADDTYTIRVRATDNGGNIENPPARRSVTIDRLAPTVSVNTLSTQSSSPGLSGAVNDAGATILVSVNGATLTAQNNGSTWTIPAGSFPGMTAGVYDVAVQATDAAGNAGVDASTNELTINLPNITVTLVAPVTGSAAGGTGVTLNGTNLDLVTGIRFGSTLGTLQSKSAGSVSVISPEHDAGDVSLTVESLSNTLVLNNAFLYFNPPPSLVSVTPTRVTTNGGTLITVNGAGFLLGALVQLDGKDATEITRVSKKVLTARAPAHSPGLVAVTVVNPDNNAVSLPNAVTYDQPPQLNSAPQLSTTQVQAGSPVQVLFGFFDPEGGTVNYSVDWGDGSPPGLATIHTFANAGIYTITLSATDGIGTTTQTLQITVTPAPGGGGEPTPDGGALRIDALSGSVRFDIPGKDAFKISGVFPALAAGSSFANVDCVLVVGGVNEGFRLNGKGKGKSAAGIVTLRPKFLRNKTTRTQDYNGGTIPFSASVKGAFADDWLDEGVRPDGGSSGVSAPFVVVLTVGATQASGAATANTAIRAGKSGKFSYKRAK